jgi:hypothetical protein
MSLTCHREYDATSDAILDTTHFFLASMHIRCEVIYRQIRHSELSSYLSPALALEYMEEYTAYEYHSGVSLRHKTRLRHDAIDPVIVTRLYEMSTQEPHEQRYEL